MTQDRKSDVTSSGVRPPSGRATPCSGAPYHGPAPFVAERRLAFMREGEMWTITIPPSPFAWQIVILSIGFLVCAIPTLAFFRQFATDLWGNNINSVAGLICPSLFMRYDQKLWTVTRQ